ncbi:hypothetical protein KM043_013090 [Ampulex compressa]|nr:hypothetical protein KM043_013090 [Ampulex compressa]
MQSLKNVLARIHPCVLHIAHCVIGLDNLIGQLRRQFGILLRNSKLLGRWWTKDHLCVLLLAGRAKTAAVSRTVAEKPTLSVPRRSQQLGLFQTTTWHILTKDLFLHAYKMQLTQELRLQDRDQRYGFTE